MKKLQKKLKSTWKKLKTQWSKPLDAAKENLRGKFIGTRLPQEGRKISKEQPKLSLKGGRKGIKKQKQKLTKGKN